MNERGSIPLALIIAAGIVLALFAAMAICGDALFEDEDEKDDLGWGPRTELADHDHDDDGGSRNKRNSNDDCAKAEAPCSDDDFSPSFDKSPVEDSFNPHICMPFATCGPEEETAA